MLSVMLSVLPQRAGPKGASSLLKLVLNLALLLTAAALAGAAANDHATCAQGEEGCEDRP